MMPYGRSSQRPYRGLLFFTAGLMALILPIAATAAAPPVHIEILPPSVVNGHVLLFKIDTTRAPNPVVGIQGRIDDRRIPVFRHPHRPGEIYFGMIGISYRSTAGERRLAVEYTDRVGFHRIERSFAVEIGHFRSENLQVAPSKAQPRAEDLERIRKEKEAVGRVYARGHPIPLWDGPFQKPLDSAITSPYGSRRLFNGKLKSYHSGVDFRASVGTPIQAANAGIVRMTRDLFFSGNHLIIDHGGGIFTSYSHLESFLVQTGRHVAKGEPIGLAGATGRVNGPHLHWGAKVHAVSVNPLDLIEALNRLYLDPPPKSPGNPAQ